MIIKGKLIQNGEPSPTNPIPIEVGEILIVKDKSGNIIQKIPFNLELDLKANDYFYKDEDGKWYLQKGEQMELEEAIKICNDLINTNMFNRNTDVKAIRIVLKELDNKNEIISKAIGHINSCKTSLGNYVLSPSETEYLLEILGDKE